MSRLATRKSIIQSMSTNIIFWINLIFIHSNFRWSAMEEKLLQAKLGTWTTPASFRATNLLFSDTTNNTVQPQTYCDGNVT